MRFGDICSLLILVFLTCVWTVKHQLKQSSIWELQTPKWLQKSCLHLYQQRTECDDSFLFSLSLFFFISFWTHFWVISRTPLSIHPYGHQNMLRNGILNTHTHTHTHTHKKTGFNCIFIATTPLFLHVHCKTTTGLPYSSLPLVTHFAWACSSCCLLTQHRSHRCW